MTTRQTDERIQQPESAGMTVGRRGILAAAGVAVVGGIALAAPRDLLAAPQAPGQVPEEIKRKRIEHLVEVVQQVAERRNRERIGRTEEVLVEGPSRTDEQVLRGRTRRNTTVNFRGVAQPGELVPVEIDGATSTTLRGHRLAAVAA